MSDSFNGSVPEEISRFRAVVVAALRAKQLLRGSKPRIDPDPGKHKNTSIAMEEVRRGLISFTPLAVPYAHDAAAMGLAGEPIPVVGLKHDAFSTLTPDEGP
jgi:DNA-directed RNA polymerase omega subunit